MPTLDKLKRQKYQRLYHLKTWSKRKNKHKLLKQRREQILLDWLKEYKKSVVCEVCGENYAGCLDFHHENPKVKIGTVSDLVAKGYGKETILREIEKCMVLCKNCHAKMHDKEHGLSES